MPSIVKVKAHQESEEAMAPVELARATGNSMADEAAKLAAMSHLQPITAQSILAKDGWDFVQQTYRAMAAILPLWPSGAARRQGRLLRRADAAGGRDTGRAAAPKVEQPHDFVAISGRIVCSRCSLIKRSWRAARKERSECSGACPLLQMAFTTAEEKGHQLAVMAWRGLAGAICTLCGAHTMGGKVDHLRFSCFKKPPSAAGEEGLSRFRRGLHPHRRQGTELLDEVWLL